MKPHGLVVGKAYGKVFAARVRELLANRPALLPAIKPLLDGRDELGRHIDALDRRTMAWVRDDEACPRSMSVLGIGPITALAFHTAIEDPGHVPRWRSVGAFFGLKPRRCPACSRIAAKVGPAMPDLRSFAPADRDIQSGEIDRSGRISKCGDRMVCTCLFEAAGVLLTRV